MNRFRSTLALIVALLVASSVMTTAAAKKPAPKKPAAKPAAKKPATGTNRATTGTTQLKGEYADIGSTYTLGKDDPYNITLKSAEYSIDQLRIGDYTFVPTAEQKLLILHMTYHNPQSIERFARWDTFGFTVVDPQSQNHDGLVDLGSEQNKAVVAMNLKPAQKIQVYGGMLVPAAGEMPKLIIKASVGDLVLRYDLRGKVKGLPAAYADPADKTAATPLAKITGQMGTYYPASELNVKVDKVEYNSATKIGDHELSEGQRYLVVHFGVKNVSGAAKFTRWDIFTVKLIDADGVELGECVDMFQATKDKVFGGEIQPGQELALRYVFSVPTDTDLKTLTIRENEGRTFVFDLSGVK